MHASGNNNKGEMAKGEIDKGQRQQNNSFGEEVVLECQEFALFCHE